MKILLFLTLLFSIYQLTYLIYIYYSKQRFLHRSGLLNPKESIALTILANKDNFFSRYLSQLTPKIVGIKVFLTIMLFIGGANNYGSFSMGFIFALIGFFLPDIYLHISNESKKNKILLDLFNIVECLKLQLSSGIALKEALREIAVLCIDNDFRGAIQEMSLRYELSEYNINFAVMGLKKDYPYKEIELFASSLEGQVHNLGGHDNFNNLSELLKERYLSNIEDNTNLKVFFIVISVIIILINLAILGSFPIIVEIMQNFEQIFS